MKSTRSDLLAMLDNIAASLPSDAEQHWSAYIHEARRLVLASDYAELEKHLSSNSGLGSYEAEFKKLSDMFKGESFGDWGNGLAGSS